MGKERRQERRHDRRRLPDRLLDKWELEEHVGLDITTIYRKMKVGTFPQPLKVGKRAVRWRAADIRRWAKGLKVGTETYDPPRRQLQGRTKQWRDELQKALADGAVDLKGVPDIEILHEVKRIRREQKK